VPILVQSDAALSLSDRSVPQSSFWLSVSIHFRSGET